MKGAGVGCHGVAGWERNISCNLFVLRTDECELGNVDIFKGLRKVAPEPH